MIIGIDHGYYATKTRHCSFPAGLTCYGSHEPYTPAECAGGGRTVLRLRHGAPAGCAATRTENDTYYLLTLAALAQETKMRGSSKREFR